MKGEETLSTKIALLEQANKNNEITHQKMMENFDKLGEKVDLIKESIDTLPERLDNRYAKKEFEDSLKKLNWMVISAVVLALLAIVIKTI